MHLHRRIERAWRLFATGLCFLTFGVGAIFISLTAFPAIHLLSRRRECANRRCQYVVHLSFRLFIWMMRSLRVLSYEIDGAEKLRSARGTLVVANHPSLIDVVFIVAQMPQALCIVKKSAWSNPAMLGVMLATGYIQNDEPQRMIDLSVRALQSGQNLVVFPEATRTVPGKPLKLRRGAASIIATDGRPFLPVIVICNPTTLTKAEKWYEIPCTRVHFQIAVGEYVNPRPLIVDGAPLSLSNRRINRTIMALFMEGMAWHGQWDKPDRGDKGPHH
jgi:1-acyl-sn-glycerol-3-phosphate acyltransferase